MHLLWLALPILVVTLILKYRLVRPFHPAFHTMPIISRPASAVTTAVIHCPPPQCKQDPGPYLHGSLTPGVHQRDPAHHPETAVQSPNRFVLSPEQHAPAIILPAIAAAAMAVLLAMLLRSYIPLRHKRWCGTGLPSAVH